MRVSYEVISSAARLLLDGRDFASQHVDDEAAHRRFESEDRDALRAVFAELTTADLVEAVRAAAGRLGGSE
jgi:hypothetical protein